MLAYPLYVPIGGVYDVMDPLRHAMGVWRHASYDDSIECRSADPYGNS